MIRRPGTVLLAVAALALLTAITMSHRSTLRWDSQRRIPRGRVGVDYGQYATAARTVVFRDGSLYVCMCRRAKPQEAEGSASAESMAGIKIHTLIYERVRYAEFQTAPTLSYLLLVMIAAHPLIVFTRSLIRRKRRYAHHSSFHLSRPLPPDRCPRCGYNLKGNVTGVCSECGERFSHRQGEGVQ